MRVRQPIRVKTPRDPESTAPVQYIDKVIERSRYPVEDLKNIQKFDKTWNQKRREAWQKRAAPYMREFLAEGLSREEIKNKLNINDYIYDNIESFLIETEGSRFCRMSAAHRFYIFMLRMEQCSRELDHFVRLHIQEDPRKSGVVGAIKAKSQIHRDVLQTGQELGIIDKRAKEIRVVGDVNLAVLPNEELRELYESKIQKFEQIFGVPKELPGAYTKLLKKAVDHDVGDESETIEAEFEEA